MVDWSGVVLLDVRCRGSIIWGSRLSGSIPESWVVDRVTLSSDPGIVDGLVPLSLLYILGPP